MAMARQHSANARAALARNVLQAACSCDDACRRRCQVASMLLCCVAAVTPSLHAALLRW